MYMYRSTLHIVYQFAFSSRGRRRGLLSHLAGHSVRQRGYDAVFVTSSGVLTSYDPHGNLNWQVSNPPPPLHFCMHSNGKKNMQVHVSRIETLCICIIHVCLHDDPGPVFQLCGSRKSVCVYVCLCFVLCYQGHGLMLCPKDVKRNIQTLYVVSKWFILV